MRSPTSLEWGAKVKYSVGIDNIVQRFSEILRVDFAHEVVMVLC